MADSLYFQDIFQQVFDYKRRVTKGAKGNTDDFVCVIMLCSSVSVWSNFLSTVLGVGYVFSSDRGAAQLLSYPVISTLSCFKFSNGSAASVLISGKPFVGSFRKLSKFCKTESGKERGGRMERRNYSESCKDGELV